MDRTSVHEHSLVLSADGMSRSLRRISHEILERNASVLEDLALVGVLTRGVPLARRIADGMKTRAQSSSAAAASTPPARSISQVVRESTATE